MKVNNESYSLREISPNSIMFDPKNPRGENKNEIEQDDSFKELRASVKKYGVLEPLIVRSQDNNPHIFQLVDGERRLRAALLEQKIIVPVHVIDGHEIDGRILAYQIHMLRKQWSKINEISSIKEIVSELIKQGDCSTEQLLFKKLKEITNHKDHDLQTLLCLLKYDDYTINKVQKGDLLLSYLVQIESSFIVPLKREFPRFYKKYGEDKLRQILVKKAENGYLGNTRYLMDNVLGLFRDQQKRPSLQRALSIFLEKTTEHIQNVVEKTQKLKPREKKSTQPKKKTVRIKETDQGDKKKPIFQYTSLAITPENETQIKDIRPKLESIANQLSEEEKEYIKEAICCLENHCLKAATLMIWSSGISRILKYIQNNLSDFNQVSKVMSNTPTSFYKHFSKNFMKDAKSVEEVRENSADRQLLCYLCYKNFITVPDFNKLKNNYDTRNDCAHPTKIKLKPNEIIVIFENVYGLILNNANLL